jgi:methylmalonyl-CoA mutase, C-terminal domain
MSGGNIREENISIRKGIEPMIRRIRVLIGKVGLDGHDVGARVVSKALADEGMEVIYTGIRQTAEQIVNAAIEEGVDLIGISILSGSHMVFLPEIIKLLDDHKANDIHLIAGGTIPIEDCKILKNLGVKEVFPSESRIDDILKYIKENITIK